MRGSPVRKTILYGAAGAILFAAAVLVLAFSATQHSSHWSMEGGEILLWVLEGQTADGIGAKAIGIACLTSGGNVVVFIPEDMSVKRQDGRFVELGDFGEEAGWGACCDAVGRVLGVSVAGYVVAEVGDMAAFCDALGSIPVDVAAPVAYRGTGRSAAAVEIGRGRQLLAGDGLVAYIAGDSGQPAAERRECALRGVVAAAQTADRATQDLKLRLRSNLDDGCLAAVGEALLRPSVALRVREIPTTVIVREGVARRMAMAVETEKIVASSLRPKKTLTSDDVSVAVFNGSGARLAATRAAEYLQARGFRVSRVGNADAFTYTTTSIVRLTEEAKAWILRDTLPGVAKMTTPAEFGAQYEMLRPMVPLGTDLLLVVGAGMEFSE